MRRLIDDFWNRANTSAGTVGNGWIDQVGSVFSINGNRLKTAPSAGGSSYTKDTLTRPSSENCLDQRIVVFGSANNTSTTVMAAKLRWSAGNSDGDNGYLVFLQYGDSNLNLYSLINGTASQIATTTLSPSVSISHQYAIDFSATGSSPTTLNVIVTDWYTGSAVGSLTAITDSTAGLQVSAGFAVVGQTATCFYDEVKTYNLSANQLAVVGIGDSIMAGYEVTAPADPLGQYALMVAKTQGYDGVTITNQAVGGTTTTDWVNGTNGASLPTAIAAAQAIGATLAVVMLGANDSKASTATSPGTYGDNLAFICNALLASGTGITQVSVNYPTYIVPGSSSGEWTSASLTLLVAYQAEIDSLVNGSTILQGDRYAFTYLADNFTAEMTSSGAHPHSTGDTSLGLLWASPNVNLAATLGVAVTQTAAIQSRVATALPNAAPTDAGGLLTVGSGAGQIQPAGNGSVPTTGASGSGAFAMTVTITDGTNPIPGAAVRITGPQSAGAISTDAAGNAIFALNSGTVTVAATSTGYAGITAIHSIDNAGHWDATGSADLTIALASAGASLSPGAGQTTAYLTTRDGQGQPIPGVTLTFSLIDPQASADSYDQSTFAATSDSTGLLQILLRQSTTYQARLPTSTWTTFTTGSADNYPLPEILGNYAD